MAELKYCCEDFEFRMKLEKFQHPNIRMVKWTNSLMFRREKNKKSMCYGFIWTDGYEKEFDLIDVHGIPMAYCPFCGKDLYRYYKSDEYVHEIEGITFKFK